MRFHGYWMLVGFAPLLLSQCASMKPEGGSVAEQRAFVDQEAGEVLRRLRKESSEAGDQLEVCEGYAMFNYTAGKMPIVLGGIGGGAGYGVAVDRIDDSRTYMKVQKLNWGWGMGVKENSVVFVFDDRDAFEKFRSGKWDGGAVAEATVKANERGADLGVAPSLSDGFSSYTLTDSGLSYGVTYRTRRFSPVRSMNR